MAQARKLYSIYDKKSQTYDSPFTAITDGDAERRVQSACRDPQTLLSQYPEDFSLWSVGSFDPQSGNLLPEKPHHMCDVIAFANNKRDSRENTL